MFEEATVASLSELEAEMDQREITIPALNAYRDALHRVRIDKDSLVGSSIDILTVAKEFIDDMTQLQMEKRNLERFEGSQERTREDLGQLKENQTRQRNEMEEAQQDFGQALNDTLEQSNVALENLTEEHQAAIDNLMENFTGYLNETEKIWQLTYDTSIGKKYELVASLISARLSATIDVYQQMQVICKLMFSNTLSPDQNCGSGLLFLPDTPLSTAVAVFKQSTIYKPPKKSTYTTYNEGSPLEMVTCASDSLKAKLFIQSFKSNKKADFNLLDMDIDHLLRDFWNVRIWQAWMQFETMDRIAVPVNGRVDLVFPQEFANLDEIGEVHIFQRPHAVKCGLQYEIMLGKTNGRRALTLKCCAIVTVSNALLMW